mgnify:CR=1 FL=1
MPSTTLEAIAVWEQSGAPARFVWRGIRWRVTTAPISLITEPEHCPPAMTHPPTRHIGWRVTARSDDGGDITSLDLLRTPDGWAAEPLDP